MEIFILLAVLIAAIATVDLPNKKVKKSKTNA